MKEIEKRILHQGIGFVVTGLLVLCISLWFSHRILTKDDHTYPLVLEIAVACFLIAFSLIGFYRGLSGISLVFSKEEREKEKWKSDMLDNADQYRGGTRKEIIILGIIAITLLSVFVVWALLFQS